MGRKVKAYAEHLLDIYKVHGDTYIYPDTYVLQTYKPNTTLIPITCKLHGVFHQSINNHKNGQHCPECSKEKKSTRAKVKMEDFIKIFYKKMPDYTLLTSKLDQALRTELQVEHNISGQRFTILASKIWTAKKYPINLC